MKGLGLTSVLALSGSIGVFAAPVEQFTTTLSVSLSQYMNRATTDSTQFNSETWPPLFPVPTSWPSPSNHSSYSVSFRKHKSGEENVKTKTKTVTEDCSATDDVERSTTVVMVPSTQVIEYHPTVTETVTSVEVVITKSLHKPKHTKHSWTETEVETETETVETPPPSTETVESPPSTVSESSKTRTKHHKSKHHKSKHHTKSSKVHSSETVETPLPTSSLSVTQTSSESSVQEVVVVTTEDVQVVTTGYEEVISTITLSEGDSRLSTLTKATPTGSSSVTSSKTLVPHSRDSKWLSSLFESSTVSFLSPYPHSFWPRPVTEVSFTESSSATSSGARELFSHYNPEYTSTMDSSMYTSLMSKFRGSHTPVTEASSTETSSVAPPTINTIPPPGRSWTRTPMTETSSTESSSVTSSGAKELFSQYNPEFVSKMDSSIYTELMSKFRGPQTSATEATSTASSAVTSSGARELFTHYNPPEVVSTIPFSVYTEQMSKFRSRHTPVPEASSTESSGAKELFSHFNPEFQSTIDPSVYTSMMSKIRTRHDPVTEASSTESSSVTYSGARELFSHYNPEYTSISDPPLEPTLLRPTHETWPFISPHGPVTPPADSTTTHTRSGHKTKEPPNTIVVETPTDNMLTLTIGPPFLHSTKTSTADDATETLFARDNGDPRKKYDKYRKPDKAMSKRMSRWSKHHSHAEEKNWSYHTKYQVKSLESQMEYDESTWSKHHKTTLAAVLPAMPSPAVNALAARDDNDDDPEKDYEKKLSKANKEHDKVSSKAEAKWSKKHDKSILKSAKKYAKSLAKQSKADDKSSKKAFKSRMKEQGHDEEAYLALVEREEVTKTTPKSAPAVATVTVTTVVGPAQNGTVSTSWRTRHASKTSGSLKTSGTASLKTSKTGSLKTSATTSVGGGN
jgi:hypothetical protein